MTEYQLALLRLISIEGFTQTLGWVFAMGMVVGAVLDDNWKKLARWILAVVLWIVVAEVVRYSFLKFVAHGGGLEVSTVLTLTTAFFYIMGILAGWCVVWLAKDRVRRQMEGVKENGN